MTIDEAGREALKKELGFEVEPDGIIPVAYGKFYVIQPSQAGKVWQVALSREKRLQEIASVLEPFGLGFLSRLEELAQGDNK